MNTVTTSPHSTDQPVTTKPSESTQAIIDHLANIERKLDLLVIEHDQWHTSFIRSLKQLLSLLDHHH